MFDSEGGLRLEAGVDFDTSSFELYRKQGKPPEMADYSNKEEYFKRFKEYQEEERKALCARLQVLDEGPQFTLTDKDGKNRLILSVAQTIATRTGTTTTNPESSILLFGPDETVIWSAP